MRIIYSDVIFSFLKKVKSLVQRILVTEMQIVTRSKGFIFNDIFYPLNFVTFEHPSTLGYFQKDFFEIGINKVFVFENEEILLDVLRHELAHYVTFIEYGPNVSLHGTAFRATCKRYKWKSTISRATLNIEKMAHNEKLLKRVQKLLALGSSHNPHEAEVAIIKARQLLVKYNLDLKESNETTYLSRIFPQKRNSAKLRAISSIVSTFFVHSIFNYGNGVMYLELLGEKTNIEIAEYVAHFLNQKFDMLWEQTKKEHAYLKGLASKNSFFRGLAQGYLHKTRMHSSAALIKIEQQLIQSVQRIYPKLCTMKCAFKHNEIATRLGHKNGVNLNVYSGIAQCRGKTYFLDNLK